MVLGNWSPHNEAWRFTPDGASNVTVRWLANGIEVDTGASIYVCIEETTTFTVETLYTTCTGVSITDQDTVTVTYGAIPEPEDLTAKWSCYIRCFIS